jgi:hypothetical protein
LSLASTVADNPTASAKPAVKTVNRNVAAREGGVTSFPDGESFNPSSPRSS